MKNKYVDLEVLNQGFKSFANKINNVFRKIKDSYTKTEIDSKLNSIAKGMNWKPSVATKTDLEALTGNNKSDARIVEEDSKIYVYNGTSWDSIGSSTNVPMASKDTDGLMSKENFSKLEGIDIDKLETKEDFNTKIGNLTSLKTTDKSNVISAINEVKDNIDKTSEIDDENISENKTYSSKKINDTYVQKEENKSLVSDTEISKIHNHKNQSQLDKISENVDGKLTYNNEVIGGELKVATGSILGGIKVGSGLNITDDGTLSFDKTNYYTKTDSNSTFATISTVDDLQEEVDNLKMNNNSISVLSDFNYTELKNNDKLIDSNIYFVYNDKNIYDYISSLGYSSYKNIPYFFNNSSILSDTENLTNLLNMYENEIFENEIIMNSFFNNTTLSNKVINNELFMTKVCNNTIARQSLYNNYKTTTNIITNSTTAINVMKNSNQFKTIIPTINAGINSNLTTDNTITYNGKAFVFDVYTSGVNIYYTHWHGSYLTGDKNRYYVGLRHGENNKLVINEFASDVRSGTDYGSVVGCADIFMI